MKTEGERQKIGKCVRAAIYQFEKKFQSLPFNYMSESDIQSELLVTLRNQLNWQIEINHPLDLKKKDESSFRKTVNLVNAEYNEKIDIVCLDPILAQEEMRRKENQNGRLSSFLWRLPILIGIEIKLVRFDDLRMGIDICKSDARKLEDFGRDQGKAINWLMLCFFHNSEALDKMVKNVPYTGVDDSLPDYNKIYLTDPEKILAVNPE